MRATWSPKGQTPVLRHHFNWSRFSISTALSYKTDASVAAMVFEMKSGTYNTETLIEFLEAFHWHFAGEKVALSWDGLPSHRSKDMSAWIAKQRRWLVVEPLAAYAPDLNPVELLWGNVKGTELANLCPDTIAEARAAAEAALDRASAHLERP